MSPAALADVLNAVHKHCTDVRLTPSPLGRYTVNIIHPIERVAERIDDG